MWLFVTDGETAEDEHAEIVVQQRLDGADADAVLAQNSWKRVSNWFGVPEAWAAQVQRG